MRIVKVSSLAVALLLFVCQAVQATGSKEKIRRENIEWLDVWTPGNHEYRLPKVLLIGNSITRLYYPYVEKRLAGKACVARYCSSKSLGDPALLDELASYLRQYHFDIVHFNVGMHGRDYTEEEYGAALPTLYELIRRYEPGAKLVWANSTPVMKRGDLKTYDPVTERVRERNRIAGEYFKDKPVVIDDLFSVMYGHPEYYEGGDGIHMGTSGVQALAGQVAALLSSLLPTSPLSCVDLFIGTAGDGHTFPGACVPFGMVQASPETNNIGWDYCSGYHFEDSEIIGFAQDHLNGTGSQDLGDVLIFPFTGGNNRPFKSNYRKYNQYASPGYYRVRFDDDKVDAEVTATEHVALYNFNYYDDCGKLLVDLQSGDVLTDEELHNHVLAASLDMPDDCTLRGSLKMRCFGERQVFFVIKTSKPYTVDSIIPAQPGEKAKRLILRFDTAGDPAVMVKVALSTVGTDGAEASLGRECAGWDFAGTREAAEGKWRDILSRVSVEGSDSVKTMFYTSLYRACIQPNNIADTDGRYRAADGNVHRASFGSHYSIFSLWDTFRAAHPLYTILTPEMVSPMVQSMLDYSHVRGFLPIWPVWGWETYGMIANHGVPVVVDACLKGFKIDKVEAYNAVKASLTRSHKKSEWETYLKYGYYPFDLVKVESVSRTMESCYDDWCAAQMAKRLGHKADYKEFLRRSGFWKNLFDPSVGLVRGKDSNGQWRTPYDPFQLGHAYTGGGDFTEGNAWQYTWQVMHDPLGLADAMGGKEKCLAKLDSLFTLTTVSKHNAGWTGDVTGLIGQYSHGNEPCHHVAYLYAVLGQPWKTQELVREITDKFYVSKPDGLSGNDDCGQMSAWYIFSAMGFYPFNPVGGDYVLGAPQLDKVAISLPNGKAFTMEAKGLSKTNKYVRRVTMNGKPVNGCTINHTDIMKGGHLVFEMTGKP